MLEPDDLVEVNKVWASGGKVLKCWFKGYKFIRYDDLNKNYVMVSAISWLYHDITVRYSVEDVRKSK